MTNEVALQVIKDLSITFTGKNKVYSNQIFKSILIPMFSDLDSPYTLAYGDFNGLNKFNHQYGNDAGTLAMINSISVLQAYLPKNTITVRISGDEYIFLMPNVDSSEIENYLFYADDVLRHSPEQYLTMSFGVVDSNEKSDIYDMYSLAESRENIAKLNSKTEKYSRAVVQKKLDEAFEKFFDNYRFSNKMELKSEHIMKLGKLAIRSALDLISSQEFKAFHLSHERAIKFSSLFTPTMPIFTPLQAREIFEYIDSHTYDDDKFTKLASSLYTTQVSKLFHEIIVNPNSGFFNNVYYESFFEPSLPVNTYKPSTIIMLELTGIKDCNAKKSHLETDQRLAELSSKIYNSLEEVLNIKFDNSLSTFNEKHNYIFNNFGGDFLIILGEQKLSDTQISSFLSSLKSVDISPMHILSSYSTDKEIPYEKTIENLKADILNKKSSQLEKHIDSSETKDSFDLFISDVVDFFMKKCPTSLDFETQKVFFQLVSNSLVEQAVKSNNEFLNNHTKTSNTD